MRKFSAKITTSAMILFLFTGLSFAQETKTDNDLKKQEEKTVQEQNQVKFRNSLTSEQKAIFENKEMTKNEKKKAFKASLSEEQRSMLKANKEMRKQQRNEFGSNASEEQKQQMRQERENVKGENAKQSKGKQNQ